MIRQTWVVVLLVAGCDGTMERPSSSDAGEGRPVDAGRDAGVKAEADGGLDDAGEDAGAPVVDAGLVDPGLDASVPDAGGRRDGGTRDAGLTLDAGVVDGGTRDAGLTLDAGVVDGGRTDAGVRDAGSGSSTDGGPVASTGGGDAGVCSTIGWCRYPNTRQLSVCPPSTSTYAFRAFCHNVIEAWSGGVADTLRNRLILWGGGHNDYYGNELYAFDLRTQTMNRLNDPSPINQTGSCLDTLSDGRPNSRHTYSGLAYVEHLDAMYAFGGSLGCPAGNGGSETWMLNLSTLTWSRRSPTGDVPPADVQLSVTALYDPVTRKVILANRVALFTYDPDQDRYTRVNGNVRLDLDTSAALVSDLRKIFIVGGNGDVWTIDLATWAFTRVTTQLGGCANLSYGPGIAYHPGKRKLVIWSAEKNAPPQLLDPVTLSCTPLVLPGAPPVQSTHPTYGRWRYFPALDVLVAVPGADVDGYSLRLP